MDVGAVLDFLLRNGFHHAAAALRDDLADGAQLQSDHAFHLGQLPPLKTSAAPTAGDAEPSSSSSDVFLSMASSFSDLTNPYFFYADSNRSADAHSEFGTARDYRDPGDANWYDWRNPSAAEGVGGDDGRLADRSEVGESVGPLFDSLGAASWSKLIDELRSGEEIKNLDLRLPLPKMDGNADEGGELDVTEFFLYHDGEKGSKDLGCTMAENFAPNGEHNELNGEFDVCSYAPQLSQVDGNHIEREHEKSNIETHELVIATDNGDTGTDNDAKSVPQIQDYQEDDFEIFELRIVHRKNRTGFEASKDIPIALNSVISGRYYVTGYIGSAAFSKVFQGYDLQTGVGVCLKIIKNKKDFFDKSLDEIKLLKFVNKHDPADEHHILRMYDYFYQQEHLFIVCELLKENLFEFQRYVQESGGQVYFTLPNIQSIARQCLEALDYLHHLGVIHCDLKPENILMKNYRRCEIKIIDLGNSCFHTDNLCLYVQSRSYRAPEVILGIPYDQKIDVWSLGCILAELYSGNVLFPNDSIEMILGLMIGLLGSIDLEMLKKGKETEKYFTNDYDLYHKDEETGQVKYAIPPISSLAECLGNPDPLFLDFLQFLLQINPQSRPTAAEALQHPWLSYRYK